MTIDEFDPGELQGGLLMQVENVHERPREARARHRVMPGNPFTGTAGTTVHLDGVTA